MGGKDSSTALSRASRDAGTSSNFSSASRTGANAPFYRRFLPAQLSNISPNDSIPSLDELSALAKHLGRIKAESAALLFALPSGSESLLAKALKIRRASVIALTTAFTSARLAHILAAIQRETGSVCQLRASWLETAIRSATQSPHYPHALPPLAQQPTSIKLLRTTQPVDLNACKAAKRTKRKQRAASWRKHKMATLQRVKDLQAQLKASRKRTATGTEITAATTVSQV